LACRDQLKRTLIMARKTYTSVVEAYVDAELAAANDERSRAGSSGLSPVGESVSFSVLSVIRGVFVRELWYARGTALLALLPALVIVARAGLGALPQLGIVTDGWVSWPVQGITIAAAVWAGLVTLWYARNIWRRARGQAPATLRFRNNQYQGPTLLGDMIIRLGVAVATLPSLLWLSLSAGEPLWRLLGLIAIPPIFFLAAVGVISALHGLAARGAVDETLPPPQSASSPEITQLDDRIAQLKQIRVWLKDDKLKSMIDDVIGKQVAKSERRQVAYSVTVGALSLLVGWLLSAISPVSALAQLLQR
jgi:hypothetical protein